MNKRISTLVAMLALATTITLAKDLVNADGRAQVALQAYDPVAFFADGKPAKGNPAISAQHKGYTYYFASEEHRMAFQKDPEQYLPAFGGYCAYGVSINKLFPVEIDTWEIVDGRLILQYSQDVKAKFKTDAAGNLQKADANWPGLVKAHGK